MDLFAAMSAFISVVEKGSFAAVARERSQSPAMIGNQVRFLEARLGVALINRSTRQHSLTDVGRAYYEDCRRILSDVASTDAAAARTQSRPSGELRVTTAFSIGTALLPPVLAEYLRNYPKVRIDLGLSDQRIDLVEHGFDVAIRAGELPDSSLLSRALRPLELVVCASPAYLRRCGTPRSADELGKHACLSFMPLGFRRVWSFSREGRTVDVPIDGPLCANSGHALRAAALEGLGIIMQPMALLAEDLEAGRLVRLLPEEMPPVRPLHLLMHPNRFKSRKLRCFVDLACARLG